MTDTAVGVGVGVHGRVTGSDAAACHQGNHNSANHGSHGSDDQDDAAAGQDH